MSNPPTNDILVSGAVNSPGRHQLHAPTTIENALEAAGGLARKENMWPAGPIHVRRPLGNNQVDVWSFNLSDAELVEWRGFELATGDLVVFEWHVENA